MNRREFLIRSGKAGGTVCAAGGMGYWLHSRDRKPEPPEIEPAYYDYRVGLPEGAPDLSVRRGSDIALITTAAIEACGGIGHYVAPGDRVVLKPNVSWDRTPAQAANTHPLIVRTVAELCLKAMRS